MFEVIKNIIAKLCSFHNTFPKNPKSIKLRPESEFLQLIEKSKEESHFNAEILNTLQDIVYVINTDGRLTKWNKAVKDVFGYDDEEIRNMKCWDFMYQQDMEKVAQAFKTIWQTESITFEAMIKTKDGKIMPYEFINNLLYDSEGRPLAICGVMRDISVRKFFEQSLERSNKTLEQTVEKLEEVNQEMKGFVYIASHDLREPLRKITSFGTILDKSLKEKLSDDDSENLHFMMDGAQRMTNMIEGLLVYSRISSQVKSHQTVDLNEIVKQLEQIELSLVLQEKQVVMEIPKSLPLIEVDPVQIRQLMQNLIANGIKYQKKGTIPHIIITSKPAADGMVRIEVTDNGIGIKPEYQSSIFVMFKRLHTRSEYEGTGIGLSVCKKIVERHGGQIGVESEPDKGATFWFTVPIAP